ncbi:glycerol-3-phosphate 1-O-acyltransferase PlsY [Gracilibacillus alcaliphilus]|uniref:glycerol-3-phosphate 1-O-acyltransferase PlsY n=1 Tax=Gracilibacillus alcaliphilus TaxID=1401441 RepID=UPI00195BE096|nr:glycerol-3-phosphate 1-O-acyltransferase PlsY [Gracilibacillus alcaliphilus]MBM7676670.1 glycerol-3-phosphate acyltransferase PlsY [Gracilibacillus alcaliphilus]
MEYIIFIILAYLLGSIPTGLIIGKVGYQKDIREHGSGNLGATNTFRVLGIKAGIAVTVIDILKGTLAATLPVIFQATEVYPLLVGVVAVIGHMFPVFAKFKGGKAVATSAGVILGVNPLVFVIMIASFLVILYLTKYVSLSSMLTGIITIIVTAVQQDYPLLIVTALLTVVVIYRHKANIKRIIDKTEPKITWM